MSLENETKFHLPLGGYFSVGDADDSCCASTTESVFTFGNGDNDDDGTGGQQVKKPSSSSKNESELPEPPFGYDAIRRSIATGLEDMVGLNLDQDVKPYKDVPAKKVMTYRVRRVVSPFEFYLEYASWPEEQRYSNWFREMQQFYEDPANQVNYELIEGVPLTGRCYVCQDYKDRKWHRVRIHQVIHSRNAPTTLIVFYMDHCKLQETTSAYLRELDPHFAQYPAHVFRCYLHDILPVHQKGIEFSPEACDHFKQIMQDNEFSGVVLTRSCSVLVQGLPDFITDLGVVLVENVPGSMDVRSDACTINAMMVEDGFASATGVGASCQHTLNIGDYDAPCEDGSCSDNLMLENMHLEDSTMESSSNQEDVESCEETDDLYLTVNLNGALRQTPKNSLPEKIAKHLAFIRICHVVNPSFIVVHLRSQEPELDTMQEAIKQQVENGERLRDGYLAMMVACNILDSGHNGIGEERSIWCRGVIKSVCGAETYKIVLVDYGNEITATGQYVRKLPDCFQQIPSFAIRVHLDMANLVPAGKTGWSMEACMQFRHYAFIWEEQEPIYFLYRPAHAKRFKIKDYGQQVVYNHVKDQWTLALQCKPQEQHEAMNALQNHPMVHSLFVSFGVELMYEIIIPSSLSSFWHFESIGDILHSKKYIVFEETRKLHNPVRLHIDIISMTESACIDRHPSLPVSIPGLKDTGSAPRKSLDNKASAKFPSASLGIKTRRRARPEKKPAPSLQRPSRQ